MKILTKDVYYYYGPAGVKRLWHDCLKYKGDQARRVELTVTVSQPDEIMFNCPHCDFSYALDNNLVLIRSKQ